jgi:hypothetical protein
MNNEQIEVSPSALGLPARRSTEVPQLLIEMPDEAAARLWIRSQLERASQLACPATRPAEPDAPIPRPDDWRVTTNRLTTCVTLYSAAIAGSITRKGRRRLRELARESIRVQRAESQLAWLRRVPQENAGPATLWLIERLSRRQSELGISFKRASRDAAKLASLAKSLGVYTTAVKLDDMRQPKSFAELTQRLLQVEAARVSKLVHAIQPSSNRSVRRALESTRRMGYLLEPVHMHLDDAAALTNRIKQLQLDLEQLATLGTIANAIVRAGRRAGAQHMMSSLRVALYSRTDGDEADLRPELLSLAWRLRGELLPQFVRFANTWNADAMANHSNELTRCANELR